MIKKSRLSGKHPSSAISLATIYILTDLDSNQQSIGLFVSQPVPAARFSILFL